MNAFQKLSRKQKRLFDKLTDQQKEEMLRAELEPTLQKVANKAEVDGFIVGFYFAHDFLYNKYLTDFADLNDEDRESLCVDLVAEIVSGKKRYDEYKEKRESKKEKN